MGQLNDIKTEITLRLEELKTGADTYIKEVYPYPQLMPTLYPALSLGYPTDLENGDERTSHRNRRIIEYPIFLIVPQISNTEGYTSVLNAIDQLRDKLRVKGTRDNLNGIVTINKGITRVEVDEIKSNQDFIVYACILTLEVLVPLG